jgi:predicted nucleotide-binding protein
MLEARRGFESLREQLERGERLAAGGLLGRDYSSWQTETRHWVEQCFGEHSRKAEDFYVAGAHATTFGPSVGQGSLAERRRDALDSELDLLRAFVSVLERAAEHQRTTEERGPSGDPAREPRTSRKVFVVHGRDEGARESVARVLEKVGLEPIILHEQPNAGRTIIEKVEAYGDVAFAVVLLTPDDRGGEVAIPYEHQRLRARQNVVLELGYFLARLGRERVCSLYKEGTEIPSDYQGVVFLPMDPAGAWQFRLARELQVHFPDIDLGKL